MRRPIHIVLTTINVPTVVTSLLENARMHGNEESCKIWIVGDIKTPGVAAQLAENTTTAGLETVYLDVEAQNQFGEKLNGFYSRLPFNNESRRNIGYLAALDDECEVLISIDDDNFPTNQDFFGGHRQTGTTWFGDLLHEKIGYHNLCEHLVIEPARQVFPRGFPFRLRGSKNEAETLAPAGPVRIGATAGLWLLEPDVDATTWLNGKISGTAYHGPATAVLEQSTWTPINTQNTSVARDLIPAFLCVPMGWDVPGGKIQRYGDIWGGYFLQALMQGSEYHVAFGHPLVEHRRNPHDYLDDLRGEFWGMILTDWLVALLRQEFRPEGNDMTGRVEQLSEFLKGSAIRKLPKWCPAEVVGFIGWTADNLSEWARACSQIGVQSL